MLDKIIHANKDCNGWKIFPKFVECHTSRKSVSWFLSL